MRLLTAGIVLLLAALTVAGATSLTICGYVVLHGIDTFPSHAMFTVFIGGVVAAVFLLFAGLVLAALGWVAAR